MSCVAVGEDVSHQAISAYFIGPRAENLDEFGKNITALLDELQQARKQYFSADGYEFIPDEVRNSDVFKKVTERFAKAVKDTAHMLGHHSIPFWSPRYQAHMSPDLSMPAMLGYLMAMIYNPNNVALEASPLSTVAEIEVGEQLCEMFDFNTDPESFDHPTGWGHITCDGTVANLESLWVARNLKFYSLSLRKLMQDSESPLKERFETFSVRTCQGQLKKFVDLSTWELLNLTPKTILDIPERLHDEFGITPDWLQSALDKYNVQTISKDALEYEFGLDKDKPGQYFVASSRHYSWPKATAILGIGSGNAVSVPVDDSARVDIDKLESLLNERLSKQQPVYSVVAVMGSTEEGAVDPLHKILALRQRFQLQGLSFLVHADAAWGGYFATMLPRGPKAVACSVHATSLPGRDGGAEGIVPNLPLRTETQQDLFALRFCDSITVDPHKAGYIPYPAGALTYRDGRIKNLVTWTSPYLSRGSVTSNIGIFGVEGSKPGAAALATWLSNQCIGLDQKGYGALLSEACFTSSRLSALWAALSRRDDSFICIPFNALPSEAKNDPQAVENEKRRIWDEILTKTNSQIVEHDAHVSQDMKTMKLLRDLGSDLNINAFAINWRYPNGDPNTDVYEANYLMTRVIQRMSVDSPNDKPTTIPLYLTSTTFSHDLYGDCVANFKKRLGLEKDLVEKSEEPLMVLRNVVMSPLATLSTPRDFINMLGCTFKKIVEEEVKICQARNNLDPDHHSFLTHGTDQVFLSYRPMFHIAKHRRQVILAVEFDEADKKAYHALKGNTEDDLLVKTSDKIDLSAVLACVGKPNATASFLGNFTTKTNGVIVPRIPITITAILKDRPLNTAFYDLNYPCEIGMPFYLYGSPQDAHIDHILVRRPNIVLSAADVTLTLDQQQASSSGSDDPVSDAMKTGAILSLVDVPEAAMQPFAAGDTKLSPKGKKIEFFFREGQRFRVKIWADPREAKENGKGLVDQVCQGPPLAKGEIVLGAEVVVDAEKVNRDPYSISEDERVLSWRDRFQEIGKGLEDLCVC